MSNTTLNIVFWNKVKNGSITVVFMIPFVFDDDDVILIVMIMIGIMHEAMFILIKGCNHLYSVDHHETFKHYHCHHCKRVYSKFKRI